MARLEVSLCCEYAQMRMGLGYLWPSEVFCASHCSASAAGTLNSIMFQEWGPEAIIGKPFDRQQQEHTCTLAHACTHARRRRRTLACAFDGTHALRARTG
jgi:hypothetical protein